MITHHLVNRLILRKSINGLFIKSTCANPSIFGLVNKRFKLDFPEEHHGTQKHSDPKQSGGFADVFVNKGVSKIKPPKTPQDFANPDLDQIWHSYGYDSFDKTADRFYAHVVTFLFCTCMWAVFFIHKWYRHDEPLNDWALREAYFEIQRRQELGLPVIDRNYIPPEKVNLPTEEELEGRQVYY